MAGKRRDENGRPIDSKGEVDIPRAESGKKENARVRAVWAWVLSGVGVIVLLTTLWLNSAAILDSIRREPPLPTVPPISVVVRNSRADSVTIATRGDFFLWLPGVEARYSTGKYEFSVNADREPVLGAITIAPGDSVWAFANLLNQSLFGEVLERGECDISFWVRSLGGGLDYSDNLPFTREGLDTYYASVEIEDD
jgi:hypothetical protein